MRISWANRTAPIALISASFPVSPGGATMTVKIDEVEPNIFPNVDDLDARDAGRHVEVFLDVRIEVMHTPITVKLSYEQASDLAILLEPFRKPSLGHAAAGHLEE